MKAKIVGFKSIGATIYQTVEPLEGNIHGKFQQPVSNDDLKKHTRLQVDDAYDAIRISAILEHKFKGKIINIDNPFGGKK
jgi:hypothetical protein